MVIIMRAAPETRLRPEPPDKPRRFPCLARHRRTQDPANDHPRGTPHRRRTTRIAAEARACRT
ncbi:hypothetical protein, partial [Streptomyces sp. SID3343]|uniref:hypothetical protein n=1 Tax=Streptomyces sp. SID3343 TaxID=2690260 RepID=UPI001F438A05